MTNSTFKISELPAVGLVTESGLVPLAYPGNNAGTFSITLSQLRSSLMFEDAFSTVAIGLQNTRSGDTFFVYTDDSQEYVYGWANSSGVANALLNVDGSQVKYGTGFLLKSLESDSKALVQWIYNAGSAPAGAQTITTGLTDTSLSVKEVYVNGLRQFLGQGFTANGTAFTLAAPLKGGELVVVYLGNSGTFDMLSNTINALYASTLGASNIGSSSGESVQTSLDNKVDKAYLLSVNGASSVNTSSGESVESALSNFITRENISSDTGRKTSGQFSINPSIIDTWPIAGLTFGGALNRGQLLIDEKGRIKTSSVVGGLTTNQGLMFATVESMFTINGGYTTRILRLPIDGNESDDNSPSVIFTHLSDGRPSATLVNPKQYSGYGWPNVAGKNKIWRDFAFSDDLNVFSKNYVYPTNSTSTSLYYPVAVWDVSSIPWGTQHKMIAVGPNTGDHFLGSLTVESNLQAMNTTSVSTWTVNNWAQYFRAKYDGLTGRVTNGTVAQTKNIIGAGLALSGTTLTLYIVVPSAQSSYGFKELFKGSGTALTVAYDATPLTVTPSGLMFLPMFSDWNGANCSMANDGSLVASDTHVRIANGVNSTTPTNRNDILNGGFVWSGIGAVKSFREAITVTRTSTGVYSVVGGKALTNSWRIRPPKDYSGNETAIVETVVSTDGLTTTVNVFSIAYTLDTTTNTVTRGKGAAMDISMDSWVDLNLSTTF